MSTIQELLATNQVNVNISVNNLQTLAEMLINYGKSQHEQERLISVEEACRLLAVTRTTLWRWAKSNYLIPVEVGGLRRYKLSDINNILNN